MTRNSNTGTYQPHDIPTSLEINGRHMEGMKHTQPTLSTIQQVKCVIIIVVNYCYADILLISLSWLYWVLRSIVAVS